MTEGVTVPELGRNVDALRQEIQAMGQGINARLDKVVSTEVYTLQSAYTDQRIASLGQDVQKERDEREALEAAFNNYRQAEADRRERERQTRLYQAIIPILLGLLSVAVAIWAVVSR